MQRHRTRDPAASELKPPEMDGPIRQEENNDPERTSANEPPLSVKRISIKQIGQRVS